MEGEKHEGRQKKLFLKKRALLKQNRKGGRIEGSIKNVQNLLAYRVSWFWRKKCRKIVSKQKKGGRNEGSIKKSPQNLKNWRARSTKKNGRRVWRAFFRTFLFNMPSRILFEKLFPLRGRLDNPIARLQRRGFCL